MRLVICMVLLLSFLIDSNGETAGGESGGGGQGSDGGGGDVEEGTDDVDAKVDIKFMEEGLKIFYLLHSYYCTYV